MPLDVGESINYVADLFLKAPIVSWMTSSPVHTALMITFIVMLIVFVVFRNVNATESVGLLSLRTGFWVLLSTMGIIFLHNKVLTVENTNTKSSEEYAEVFDGGYNDEILIEDSMKYMDDKK